MATLSHNLSNELEAFKDFSHQLCFSFIMSLYQTQVLKMAARAMHLSSGNLEHFVVTVMTAMQDVYVSDLRVINSAEKPPTQSSENRRRKVDSITLLAPQPWPTSWMLRTCGIWECKRADATSPREVETCESQLVDAAQRLFLNTGHTGSCYLFSIIGDFWKAFLYTALGQSMKYLTGEADDQKPINSYMDVTDPLEAGVIDAIRREISAEKQAVTRCESGRPKLVP